MDTMVKESRRRSNHGTCCLRRWHGTFIMDGTVRFDDSPGLKFPGADHPKLKNLRSTTGKKKRISSDALFMSSCQDFHVEMAGSSPRGPFATSLIFKEKILNVGLEFTSLRYGPLKFRSSRPIVILVSQTLTATCQ